MPARIERFDDGQYDVLTTRETCEQIVTAAGKEVEGMARDAITRRAHEILHAYALKHPTFSGIVTVEMLFPHQREGETAPSSRSDLMDAVTTYRTHARALNVAYERRANLRRELSEVEDDIPRIENEVDVAWLAVYVAVRGDIPEVREEPC